jgi:hypothetical protein
LAHEGGTMKKIIVVVVFIITNIGSFFIGVKSVPENIVEKNCTQHGYKSKECVASVQAAQDVNNGLAKK